MFKKNAKNADIWLASAITFIVLCVVMDAFLSYAIDTNVAVFFSQTSRLISGIFNSTQFSIVYLYQDLVIHHGSLHDWHFSSVPYFFPDAVIFFFLAFVLNPLVQHLAVIVLLSNIALLVLYYLLIVTIGVYISGEKSKNIFRLSVLTSLLLASLSSPGQEVFVPLWTSHFGSTIIIYLLGMLLILKTLVQEKKIYYLWMGILVFLTSFSDPYFFVIFVGSMSAGCIFQYCQHRQLFVLLKIMGIIFLTGLLGFTANFFDIFHLNVHFVDVAKNHYPVKVHFSWASVMQLRDTLTLLYRQSPLSVFFSCMICLIGVVLFLKRKHHNNVQFAFILVCVAASIVISVFAAIFLDSELMRPWFSTLRHFQTAIILPMALCVPLCLSDIPRVVQWINQYYIGFLSVILGCVLLFQPIYSLNQMVDFYPPITQCLDEYAETGQLVGRNGVSRYYDAHFNDIFSKKNLNVVAINEALHSTDWLSTRHDYQGVQFNFVLVYKRKLSVEKIIEKWGHPDVILGCSQAKDYHLYVYNTGFYLDK